MSNMQAALKQIIEQHNLIRQHGGTPTRGTPLPTNQSLLIKLKCRQRTDLPQTIEVALRKAAAADNARIDDLTIRQHYLELKLVGRADHMQSLYEYLQNIPWQQ